MYAILQNMFIAVAFFIIPLVLALVLFRKSKKFVLFALISLLLGWFGFTLSTVMYSLEGMTKHKSNEHSQHEPHPFE
ncbi:MAG: hypothetical protein GY750_10110 [Lentisphaerae bacterium]|nr:hypothetical protein [Lentisphaerota bacterium]MCP4101763.1 hypothetical protein [Lentisphaerota bacterium]